jgi:hypothetical protein
MTMMMMIELPYKGFLSILGAETNIKESPVD